MPLADLFTLNMSIGSFFNLGIDVGKSRSVSDFLVITISVAGNTITYNLLDLLLILAISVVATVLVEKIARQTTPGGFIGGFLIALIGIWLFITFVPLTWNQDYKVATTHVPLITSFIGAVLSILVAHLLRGIFRRRPRPAKA